MKFFALALLLVFPALAAAQTTPTPAGPTWILEWDQPVTAAAPITAFSHLSSVDGAAAVALPRTCGAVTNGVSVCRAAMPAMTPGTHTVRVIARAVINGATFEAPPAAGDTISIELVVVAGPQGVRVVRP